MKKFAIFLSFIVLFFIILVFVVINDDSAPKSETGKKQDEAEWLIKQWEYGEKYPYKIDELMLYCKGDAVWFEDIEGKKYALNGTAKSYLKNDKNYKGDTEAILKPGAADLFTPDVAFGKCLRIN